MNNRQEFVNKWIGWLDADIRQGVFAEWQKDNKRELKEFLEEFQTDVYYEEIQLSREFVKAIAQENLPMSETTQKAYMKLLQHYAKEIEEGIQ